MAVKNALDRMIELENKYSTKSNSSSGNGITQAQKSGSTAPTAVESARSKMQSIEKKYGLSEALPDARSVDYGKIQSFLRDAQDYSSKYISNVDWKTAHDSDWLRNWQDSSRKMGVKTAGIRNYIEQNRKSFDTDTYRYFMDYLDSFEKSRRSVNSNVGYFAQWETEEDYNKFLSEQEDYDRKRTADIPALEEELDSLKKQRGDDTSSAALYQSIYDSPIAKLKRFFNPDEKWDLIEQNSLEYQIQQKQQFLDDAKLIQYAEQQALLQQKYQGKSYDELQTILAQMPPSDPEYELLQEYAPTVMRPEDYSERILKNTAEQKYLEEALQKIRGVSDQINLGGEDPATVEQYEALTQQYGSPSELESRIEELKAENWQYQKAMEYNFLDENEDYGKLSSMVPEEKTSGFGVSFGTNWLGPGDQVYDYINNIGGAREAMADQDGKTPYAVYDHMKDNEIKNYNYLYNAQGQDAAKGYLDYLEYTLNQRRMGDLQDSAAQYADKHAILSSALSVPMNLVSGVGILDVAAQNMSRKLSGEYKPIDYNRVTMAPTAVASATRGAVSQKIADATGTINLDAEAHPILSRVLNGKSLGDVYQLGMSMVDSAAIAGLAAVGIPGGTALLGGSAASQGVLDALEAGANDSQALTMGILNGVFEALFEEVSLEKLLKGNTKGIIKSFLQQGAVEGSEEFFTTLANTVADTLVMAEKSDYRTKIAQYMSQGLDEKQATLKALEDIAIGMGWDFVGGMLTGGIMGAAAQPIQNYAYGTELKKAGITAGKLAEIGKTFSADTVAYKLAGKVDNNTGAYTIGRLFNEIGATLTEQNKADIAQSLESKGMEPEIAQKHAEIMEYIVEGGTLSDTQIKMIEKNNVLASTLREVIIDPNSTVNHRISGYNEVAKQLETGKGSAKTSENASRTKQTAPGQENTASENTMPSRKTTAAEASQKVSENGKTTRITTGEEVKIDRIESLENGKMTFRLEDGSTVDSSDILYANEGDALVYETVAGMNVGADTANLLFGAYKTSRDVSAAAYARGMQEAFQYGLWNAPKQDMTRGPFSRFLTEHQQNVAYENGRIVARQRANQEAKKGGRKESGKVHFDGDRSKLNDRQRTSISALETIAQALGVQIYLFESEVQDGKHIGKNGWYDPKDGSIHIDLYAGTSGQDTMLFTAAHELTHFIRQWSEKKFRVLSDFLMEEYGRKGVSVQYLVEEQINKAKKNGRTIDLDTAFEEVVADSMETMLADGKAIEKLAKLKQQDKPLWDKMKSYFHDLAEKIRKAYAGLKPDSLEGKFVADMKDSAEKLQELFVEGLADAGENYQAANEPQSLSSDSGEILYSERDFSEQVDEVLSGTFDRTNALYMGDTPQILSSVGLNGDLPMLTTANHIKNATLPQNDKLHHHGLSVDQVKQLPEKLADPAMIMDTFDSSRNSIVIVTDMLNADGVPVIAVVKADGKGMYNNVEIDANFVTSYYGKNGFTNFVRKNVEADNILYVNKKKATVLSTESGTQWLEQLKNYDFDTIIRKARVKVKENGAAETLKFSDRDSAGNELTQAQQEYFKDSKVRDDDGNLLVMYHGTPNGGFTKFRSGSYFTQNPEYATVYQNPGASMLSHKKNAGTPQNYQVYLNIEKPFDTRNTKERRIFMQEYYRQYGTGAPLSKSGLPDWTDGLDLQEFIEDMGYDYDGLILDEGATGGYGEEVKSRGLSYVTFHPEQVKNVDNTTPTSDPDIRFSDRDPSVQRMNQALEKENAKLKEDVTELKKLLKLQKSLTHGAMFTKASVESMAKALMENAGAKGAKSELAGLLNEVYTYIARNEELTWEGVVEKAQPAVDWIQEHVEVKQQTDPFGAEVLHELRGSRIYLDEQQRQEAANLYGSFNAFRKSLFGTVTITDKNSVSLDSKWSELSERYPGIFDPNTNSNDMPGALMDAIDSLRDMGLVENWYDQNAAAQDLLAQVYDGYWRVSTLHTVADVKQKQIDLLKGEHLARMEKVKSDHKAEIAKLKQEHRAELKQVRQEYRESAEAKQRKIVQKYQESRAKGVESRNKTAMRHKVQNVVKELNDYLLKGTKDKHVPIELQKAVAEALDAVNMDTVGAEERIAKLKEDLLKAKTPEKIKEISRKIDHVQSMGDSMKSKLQALKDGYEEIIHSDDPMVANAYDPGIAAQMMTLMVEVGDTPLRDMSLRQLEAVHDVYTMVLTTIRNANKTFKAARNATVRELGQKVMAEVKDVGGKRQYSTAGMKAIRKFGWNNLKPVYAFEMIGSGTFSEIFKNVRAGEDVWAVDVNEARDFYLETAKKYGYNTWDNGKWHEFTSASGMDFSLNLEQIMSLYAYSKREQAADHLRKGGIVIDETTEVTMKTKLGVKVKFNPTEATAYNISDDTLMEIIGKLTPEQKSFVDEMQTYLSSTMSEKGNEVSLQMYGVKLFKEKNYFPLKSASQYMAKAKEQQQGEVKIKNSGFSKETVKHASNPVVLTPFMQVWADHVNDMSMYHAFVLPMEDFYRVYNYNTPTYDLSAPESVDASIQNAYGKGATKYIDQLLKDLNGGARVDSTTGVINKSMNLFKKGAVFASASVVIQQPSAIARALSMIDMKYFAGPKVDKKGHKGLWEELKHYAPVAAIKEMGYFDTNMGKSTQDYILGQEYEGIGEKAKALFTDSGYRDEALSRGAALADEVTWCSIWEAVKRETKAKNPGMDVKSEEFLKLAGERFTDVIVKTQVYDSVLSRSANMRSKDTGMKMATAFMAEPTTSINMVVDALVKGKRNGVEGRRYCRRAIGSVVAAQILNSILVSFVYAARDDDEDETYLEKYAGSFVAEVIDGLNPATYIPFIKDIVSIVQGYDVERSDMAVVSDLWNAWEQLDSDNLSGWRKVEGFAGSICQIFGLPLKNIMRDIRGMYQAIDTFTHGQKTTLAGLKYAMQGAVTGKDISDREQLYQAYLAGDKEHLARVRSRYDGEDSYNAAMRTAIKEHFLAEDIDETLAAKYLVKYGGQDGSEAHWTVDEWKYAKENGTSNGYGKFDKFYTAVRTGEDLKTVIQEYTDNGVSEYTLSRQITTYFKPMYVRLSTVERSNIKGYLVNALELCGVERDAAMERIGDWDFEAQYGFAYEDRKQAYMDGQVSAADLRKILVKEGGYTAEDAAAQVEVYDWNKLGYDATVSNVKKYNTYCKPAGVPKDAYLQIVDFSNNTENDVDADGNAIYYSAVQKIMVRINQLSIPDSQKTAIALSLWKESTVEKYKLW